ncbi:MAG: hypothetical protein SPD47_10725 [Oscillospiraceae bacterium]|nr:hypothetical protein [Oscillospiraceae bacterium]
MQRAILHKRRIALFIQQIAGFCGFTLISTASFIEAAADAVSARLQTLPAGQQTAPPISKSVFIQNTANKSLTDIVLPYKIKSFTYYLAFGKNQI